MNTEPSCAYKNAAACADELDTIAAGLQKRIQKIRNYCTDKPIPLDSVVMAASFAADRLEQAASDLRVQIRRNITQAERWF